MIVAIEGIDASGKATQVKRLLDRVTTCYATLHGVETHDFPHYQSTAGGVVGRVLKGETLVVDKNEAVLWAGVGHRATHEGKPLPSWSSGHLASLWSRDKAVIIQSMMIIDRMEWQDKLKPFTRNPFNLLILDRYTLSGIAYGMADALAGRWLRQVQAPLIQADLHIVLDITVDESVRRRPERRDYYERNYEKLETVRDLYLNEVTLTPNVRLVDGMQNQNAVTDCVYSEVKALFDSVRVS